MDVNEYREKIKSSKDSISVSVIKQIKMPKVLVSDEYLMVESLYTEAQIKELTATYSDNLKRGYKIIGDDALGNFIVTNNKKIFYWDMLYAYVDVDKVSQKISDTETMNKFNTFVISNSLEFF